MRKLILIPISVLILLGLCAGIYALPPVHDKLAWRVDELKTQIKYAISPPEKAVFVPQNEVDAMVHATLQALTPSASPTGTATLTATPPQTGTPAPSSTPEPTPTPTLTPTPLPAEVKLAGFKYQTQHGYWNYCAPANLTMALSYWGREDKVTDIGDFVKPYEKDKNVMPYELVEYVEANTNLWVKLRAGGDLPLLKRMVANGYPVLVEKGAYIKDTTGVVSWMGHYEFVTGYEDAKSEFIVQDSFFSENYRVSYTDLEKGWRAFNYTYLVLYPPEEDAVVAELLGADNDLDANRAHAAQKAADEIPALTGADQFFAWFNRGTSLLAMLDYAGAAQAYDQAFALYATLPEDKKVRPYRMIWYQTGPYFAYFNTGRYQDVINLADTTLDAMSEPTLEESYVWRARARAVLGDTEGAIEDFRKALEYHPNFSPAVAELQALGQTP